MSPATTCFRFGGRVAIVTGATSLIGATIVRAFHRSEASVIFVGRDSGRGESLAADLGDRRATFVRADVGSDDDLTRVVRTASDRYGGVDLLVNNAVSYDDRGLETTREEWLAALDVNLVSAALLVSLVAPSMRERGGGAIVNVCSVGGKFGARDRATYPASKAALLQLTRNQAASLARDSIRVNSVSPGWTWSDRLRDLAGGSRARADAVSGLVQPLGRAGDPDEVADAVLFLCSDAARFVTGEDLAVDGGFAMLGPDGGRPAREWFEGEPGSAV